MAANGHKSKKYPRFLGNVIDFFCIYIISWVNAVIKKAIAAPSFFKVGIKMLQAIIFIVNEIPIT